MSCARRLTLLKLKYKYYDGGTDPVERRAYLMKKITVADTLELSIPERIQLVEDIWDTIAEQADSLELTEEEKRIVDERLDAYHKNPDLGFPWNEVFKRITAKHGI